jgi:hypothetical protein
MVGYVPVGPLDRMWGVENLLVSYDANGVVKTFVIVGDSHLLQEFDFVDSAVTAVLDLSSPVTLDVVPYWIHEKHKPAYGTELVSSACMPSPLPRQEPSPVTSASIAAIGSCSG